MTGSFGRRQVADLKPVNLGLARASRRGTTWARLGLDHPRGLARPVAQKRDRRPEVEDQAVGPLAVDHGPHQHVVRRQHLERHDRAAALLPAAGACAGPGKRLRGPCRGPRVEAVRAGAQDRRSRGDRSSWSKTLPGDRRSVVAAVWPPPSRRTTRVRQRSPAGPRRRAARATLRPRHLAIVDADQQVAHADPGLAAGEPASTRRHAETCRLHRLQLQAQEAAGMPLLLGLLAHQGGGTLASGPRAFIACSSGGGCIARPRALGTAGRGARSRAGSRSSGPAWGRSRAGTGQAS